MKREKNPGRGMLVQAPWILALWRPFRGRLALIATGQLLSTAVAVSLPLVLKTLFDGLAAEFTLPALERAVWIYFGIATLDWLLAGGLVLARGTMNMRFEWEARQRTYDRLVHLGPAFFQRHRTGDLVTRLTDDVAEKLCWFVCSGIFRALTAVFVVVFGVAMMLRLDPWLTLFTAGPLPVLIILFIRTGTVLDRRFDEVQGRISDLNAGLEACFSGIRVVKSYGREAREQQSFLRAARACRASEIDAAKAQTLVNALYGQMWQLGVVAVLLFGGLQVMSGRLSLGAFIAFDAYVLMLIFPMLDIGTFFVKGWQSAVSIARVREVEEAPVEVTEPDAARAPSLPFEPALEIEAVSYRYPGGSEALADVSLAVRPGERVAVAGPIGSGKSTLLRLFPRLMDPASGAVRFGGLDLRDWSLSALRSAVAYVPQEPILLSGSVRDNVVFDRPGISEERIRLALQVARLEADLAQLDRGLETRVGVRGVSLSGGQKQRVALARALAGDPRLLVMDDPTAALDAETEAALWGELTRQYPGLTTIVVTHRCATLELADRILVLAGGRAAETGTHAELSRRGGVYVSLYRRHLLEERLGREVPDPARD